MPGVKRNRGYSLDGDLLWEFDGRMVSPVVPSPFTVHGLCYIGAGFVADNHRPTFALRPGASSNLAPEGDYARNEAFALYQERTASYNTSQLVYGDHSLYALPGNAAVVIAEEQSGSGSNTPIKPDRRDRQPHLTDVACVIQ